MTSSGVLWAVLLTTLACAAEPDFAEVLRGDAPLSSKHALTPGDRALLGQNASLVLSAVARCVKENRLDLLRGLHEAGWTPDAWAIEQALLAGNLHALDLFLETPVSEDRLRGFIHWAAHAGSKPMVERLARAGASLSDALPGAVAGNHVELTRWLVQHGARPPLEGVHSLLFVSRDRALAALLLPMSPPLDVTDGAGRTALHGLASRTWACSDPGQLDVARFLLEHGASVGLTDSKGMTALTVAAESNCTALGALLLANGADARHRDGAGLTPLHHAASSGAAELTRLLLERGAEVDARDTAGATPLHLAARGTMHFAEDCPPRGGGVKVTASLPGHPDVLRSLLAAGADPRAVTKDGAMALAFAERAQREVRLHNERSRTDPMCLGRRPLKDFTEVMHLLMMAMRRR
jgi:hypothetical protein